MCLEVTKMSRVTALLRGVLAALMVAAAACGGGGDSAGPSNPSGAAPRPVVAVGAITGFGSVFVNGVRFDTRNASVQMDDRAGTETELEVGHVVRIEGQINADHRHATATRIDFDDAVEGPVQSSDAAAVQLVVLGQTVRVDAMTAFDNDFTPASLAGVAVGDVVEVSGFRDADGVILATRIDLEDDTVFDVTGTVSDLDAAAKRFHIAALTVDYSAAQLDDLPGGAPANGLIVEAKGTLDANGVLLATRIEGKDRDMQGDDNDEGELEGVITRFVSATDFDVNGQAVTTNADT